jgi:GT2 family glycosyltransferase
MAKDQHPSSHHLPNSFLYRVLRKLLVLCYRVIAPFRNVPMELHQIYPAFSFPMSRPHRRIKVLAIVPFKDKVDLTQVCVQGLLEQDLTDIDLCIALVDNNSSETETHLWLQSIRSKPEHRADIRLFTYKTPFNFSYLNNRALEDCSDFGADVVAFINNDIEFTDRTTVRTLALLNFGCEESGAVGCTLLFPSHRIQHLFVYVGSKIVGSHPWRGRVLDPNSAWFKTIREVPGVTGAVMFVKARDFVEVGGFDEKLATSYQDVDLCLKFQKMGRKNLTVPFVINTHHETQTRSQEPNWEEAAYAYEKWGDFLRWNPSTPSIYTRLAEELVPGISSIDKRVKLYF